MNDNESMLNLHFQYDNKPCTISLFDVKFAKGADVKKIEVGGHQYFYKENGATPEQINTTLKSLGDVQPFETERKLADYVSNNAKIAHLSITHDIYDIGTWKLLGRTHVDTDALKQAKEALYHQFIETCKAGESQAILGVIERAKPPLNPKALFEIADQIEREGNPELARNIRDVARPFDLKSVISQSPQIFKEHYVDREKGDEIAEKLEVLFESGKFEKIYDRNEFVDQLSIDLREIGNDQHLEIVDRKVLKEEDYKSKVKSHVENGVGYFELTKFDRPTDLIDGQPIARLEVEKALNQIRDSKPKAIIIDLRQNHGGSPYMMAYIASHFIQPDQELARNVYRDEIQPDEMRSFPTDPVKTLSIEELPLEKRMLNQPIFILTSRGSLSSAECLTYHLKEHRQATIIGEQTGGGAYVSKLFEAGPDFYLGVSFGDYVLNSGEPNWEVKGIAPDIQVKAEEALEVVKQHTERI
jgi:retinol-binding protein 3